MRTKPRKFLGMNIKGTPAMKASQVSADLLVGRRNSDVLVTQEFRWPWYWRALAKSLPVAAKTWHSAPRKGQGFLHPVKGAQAVTWDTSVWRWHETCTRLLHNGAAKISEARYIRAALLEDKETGLKCWFGTTHFVVGGDERGDGPIRKQMMKRDLEVLDHFLTVLGRSGYPVLMEFDANIHVGSEAYAELRAVLKKHGATIHGNHGVEYLISIDGKKIKVQVMRNWIIATKALFTDHEGRGVTYCLVVPTKL